MLNSSLSEFGISNNTRSSNRFCFFGVTTAGNFM